MRYRLAQFFAIVTSPRPFILPLLVTCLVLGTWDFHEDSVAPGGLWETITLKACGHDRVEVEREFSVGDKPVKKNSIMYCWTKGDYEPGPDPHWGRCYSPETSEYMGSP